MTLTNEQQTERERLIHATRGGDPYTVRKAYQPTDSADGGKWWTVETVGGTCGGFFVPDGMPEPKEGDTMCWHHGLSYNICGGDLNGVPYWFKTDKEQRADRAEMLRKMKDEKIKRWEKEKVGILERYSRLPLIFQERVDGFVEKDEGFWVDSSSYEIHVLIMATEIAAAALQSDNPLGAIDYFDKMPYEDQVKVTKEVAAASGFTYGAGVSFARHLINVNNDKTSPYYGKVLESRK